MNVVVDTSVWSLALRRKAFVESAHTTLLAELIRDGQAVLLGIVRQELLSGIRHVEQFARLRDHLRAFPDPPFELEDFETAASWFNNCMAHGIQGSMADYLICAFATRRKMPILSVDPDFDHFANWIPISRIHP